jgi:hypothetical protein
MASTIYAAYRRQRRLPAALRRFMAGIGTFALAALVATQVEAQLMGGGAKAGKQFMSAPKAQVEEASGDMIFGIPANTIFFVAVAVAAVLWFTLGGGRRAKVRDKV